MKKTISSFLFIFLLILPILIYASPLFLEDSNINVKETDLTIVSPKFYYAPRDDRVNLSFDVLDANYTRINESNIVCGFSMVNSAGRLLEYGFLNYSMTYKYYYYEIDTYNYDNGEILNYYVICSTTLNNTGFISQGLMITPYGKEYIIEGRLFNFWIYVMFVGLGLVLMFMMFYFDSFEGVKIVLGSISASIFFIITGLIGGGFKIIPEARFIIDIDYYLMALTASLGLFTVIISYLSKKRRGREEEEALA